VEGASPLLLSLRSHSSRADLSTLLQTMKEVDKGQEAELSDLVDVLGSWGASGGLDVDMS